MRKMASKCALSVTSLACAWVLAVPAFAAESTAAKQETAELAEVVVTGSLIARPNNTAVSPITTVSAAAVEETGNANLTDALNQLPGLTVGGNTATGGQSTGARATLNLHGLGTNRNLVLLDGRRLPVSDISGNVDINILPEAIISGVDVITGGASAVYGSDAMSGVVNFKTIRKFEGAKVDVLNSLSEKGDAWKLNASAAFGGNFSDDRGNVTTAFTYGRQDPVQGSTRPFFHDKTPSSFIGYGTYVPSAANAPSAAVLTGLFNGYGVAGARVPLTNYGFNNDGTLFVQNGAQNYKGPTDGNGYMVIGGNVRMPVGQQIQYINSLDRKTAFVKADYAFTPSLDGYAQFMFIDLTVNTESGGSLTQFPALTTIPVTNPFIPTDLRTVLASRPTPNASFNWNGRYVGVPDKNWDENYKVSQYLLGLRGAITDHWSFDVFAATDQSIHDQAMHNAVLKSQVQILLNAADGGRSLCAGGFNPFGDTNARSLSPQCQAFITKDARSQESLGQDQFQAQVNGKLFDLGAGPVQLALLGTYRKNTYQYSPDADIVAPNAFNIFAPTNTAGNIEGLVNTLPVSKQKITVKEFAAQIDVPLLSDKSLARELAVGAAFRSSDYSSTGTVSSYEGDIRWKPVDSLLVRGSYQRAVRVPNIGELYSPQQGTQLAIGTPPASIGDPCDTRSTARTGANAAQVAALCVAQGIPLGAIGTYTFATTATGALLSGNLGLTPEEADTYNIGLVFNSSRNSGWLSEFSVSLDYFNISINNVISTVPGLTVLSKCYNLDGTNPTYSVTNLYCSLITRDQTNGQLLNVATPYQNLGALKTDGVDLQVHWGIPVPFGTEGRAYVDAQIGLLNNYEVQLLPGGPFFDYTGVSVGGTLPGSVPPNVVPEVKALTTFGYRAERFGGGLRWRYQSSLDDVSTVLTPNNVQPGVPTYQLWDLFGSYRITPAIEVRGGVTNLFDKELPIVSSSQNLTDTAVYDVIGRSYYVGLSAKF
jgi:iron complex outermembrane recepter protein